MIEPPTIHVIQGGLLTTGFSDRRGRKKNLLRRWTTCDTAVKNSSNPEWYRLAPRVRLAHDELERYVAHNVTGARITGASRFNHSDWNRVALTTRGSIEKLVVAGWAAWDGADLIVLNTDVDGEDAYVERLVRKKLAGHTREKGGVVNKVVNKVVQKSPRQMAEPSHFEDTAPAPAPQIRGSSDLRSSPRRETSTPPPPSARGGAAGAAGGGGGSIEPRKGADPEGFREWLDLYAGSPSPEVVQRLSGERAVREALRAWDELEMSPAGVRELMKFTARKLREPMNERQHGRFRYAPGKFLRTVWKPELMEARKRRADRRGDTGAASVEGSMHAYLESLHPAGEA